MVGDGSAQQPPCCLESESMSEMVEVEEEEAPGLTALLQSKVNMLKSDHSERMPVFEAKRDSCLGSFHDHCLTASSTSSPPSVCGGSVTSQDVWIPARQKGSSVDPSQGHRGTTALGARAGQSPLWATGHTQSHCPVKPAQIIQTQSYCLTKLASRCAAHPSPPSLPGDSMITLNKFNEEDDDFFMGIARMVPSWGLFWTMIS